MKQKLYEMNDGSFTFYCANYGSWANDKRIIFRVREDSSLKKRAVEKGILNYDRLVLASPEQILLWLESHAPEYHFS